MMLTSKARYGVMAMVDLALQSCEKPVNLSDISQRQQIAIKFLEQIFNKLKQKDLVKATKGPGGGYSLNTGPDKIYVLDIIMAVEEQIKMTKCSIAAMGCTQDRSKCITHDLWEGLTKQIHNYFNSITLRDICENYLNNKKMVI